MSKEPEYIVCIRVDENKQPVTGSTITHCTRCDTAVWFALTSHHIMMMHDAKPLCSKCAMEIAPPDVKIHPPTPEQAEEIKRELEKEKPEQ